LALRSALDMPYVPLTLFGYVRSHSAIMLSSALSLAMLVAAAGVGAAPLVGGLLRTRETDLGPEFGQADVFASQLPETFQNDELPWRERAQAIPSVGGQPIANAGPQAGAGNGAVTSPTTAEQPTRGPWAPAATDAVETTESSGQERSASGAPTAGVENPGQFGAEQRANGPDAQTAGQVALPESPEAHTQPAEGTAQSQQPGPMGTGQSAVEAVANAIADNDLPGDLGALLNDDLFSQIFDVDVLFDPFLKSLRDSVEDVGIAELRKQAQIVTACLYAVDNASPAEQDAA